MIIRLAEGNLQTRFGIYNQVLYYDGRKESIALVMGDVAGQEMSCAESIPTASMVMFLIASNAIVGSRWSNLNGSSRRPAGV